MNIILVTGGCGFVGSTLAIALKSWGQADHVIAFDNLRRPGSVVNLPRLRDAGVHFVHGDTRCWEDLDKIVGVTAVIDCAADASVLAGIHDSPDVVVNTNLIGTLNCLRLARRTKAVFVFLSSSRVYPIQPLMELPLAEDTTRFSIRPSERMPSGVSAEGVSEDFTLLGSRSFYGASKLASELFIQEYAAFYGLPAIINRCGVITGPWQMGKVDQGVVALWLAAHFWRKPLTYVGFGGTGKQVRDILSVEDIAKLVFHQLRQPDLYIGKTFNIGGGTTGSVSLLELTQICELVTGHRIPIRAVPDTRAADIPWFITDYRKVSTLSSWQPQHQPVDIVSSMFDWMRLHEGELKVIFG